MKTSTNRILTAHVGSLPRPENIRALLRARLSGQPIDEAQLAARVAEAVAEVVRQQAEVGLNVIADGEMGKTSFLAYEVSYDIPKGAPILFLEPLNSEENLAVCFTALY
jgi:5-methyltetrahydropteroyltriglutamate--homocysteine methyltransferase